MQLQPLLLTLALVALAELGDKTQLTVLTLSVKYPGAKIFAGAASAYLFLTLLAIAIGTALFKFIDPLYIKIISSLFFIIFGIFIFIKAADQDNDTVNEGRSGFLTSFSLIALTELGDKTQLITIALAAKYRAPLEVFIGALLGLWLITFLSIIAGKSIMRIVKDITLLHRLAGIIFIILGVVSFFL